VTPKPLRRTAAAALAFLLAAACKGGDDGGPKAPAAPPLPPGTQALASSAHLPPPAATSTCYSPPARVVIRSAQEWTEWWIHKNRRCDPPPVPRGVDFAKEMLVYAAIGKRMSPRDQVSIDGAGVRNDSLIIVLRRTTLQESCPTAAQPSFPQALVKLPLDARPVRFSEAHIKLPCD
jgi:hypothetical protein